MHIAGVGTLSERKLTYRSEYAIRFSCSTLFLQI